VRWAGGLVAVLLAVVFGLFGVILILYRGDAGSEQDIDISFWDAATIDSDIVGIVFLVVGAALTLMAVRLLRRV
jgi:drug/metabolite transporter (DMT)-like permease